MLSLGKNISGLRLDDDRYNIIQQHNNLFKNRDELGIKNAISNYSDLTDKSRSKYLDYLKLADEATNSNDRAKYLELAREEKGNWNFNNGQLENLKNGLLQVTASLQADLAKTLQEKLSKLVAPDMQNINSLAGYGLNINKVDDA
jgi:hypothetical protein